VGLGPSTASPDHGHGPAATGASVIACAFSSQRLEQTIACVESVLAQRPPPQQVIVVVDHNEDLRAMLRARLPAQAEIVANHREPGLSSARNTGVALSTGDPIVFIDDDAVAHEHWLARLLGAFEDPDVLGVGGHAMPAWEYSQPAWFPDEFLWVVGCSYRGLVASGPVRNPLGCNMAFRADVFDRVGLFDPGMGRLGDRPLGCEETEFCIRLTRSVPGGQLVLVSGANIQHRVPQDRGRPSYLLRRCYYEGISKALVRKLGDTRSLNTERTYVRRTLPSGLGRSVRVAVAGPGRIGALGRIAAVIGGLTAAAAGYVFGTVAFRIRPPVASCSRRDIDT
jgi:GT2 family glycosyltransferase